MRFELNYHFKLYYLREYNMKDTLYDKINCAFAKLPVSMCG